MTQYLLCLPRGQIKYAGQKYGKTTTESQYCNIFVQLGPSPNPNQTKPNTKPSLNDIE